MPAPRAHAEPPGNCPVSGSFDPFGDEFQADPPESLREARRSTPVFYSAQLGYYVVTGYEDIRHILKDTDGFSTSMTGAPITPLCEAAQATLSEGAFKPVKTLGSDDGPLHIKRRRAFLELFSPDNLETWAPRVREVVSTYIDGFIGRGHADLVSELFWEAPAVVALEFMGVPADEVELAKRYSAGIMNFKFGRPSDEEQIATCQLMCENQAYARNLLARIKADPSGPGFLPTLIRAWRAEPEAFEDEFLLGLATTTVAAAHETTSHAQANGLLILLTDIGRWSALCRDLGVIPDAVEECLRLGPSLTALQRLCVRETVVRGVTIPAGAKVLLSVASGNCDEEAFPHADGFVGRRNSRRHLAFGSGPHVCLGAGLARLQIRVTFEELARRLPHMRLATGAEPQYRPSASPRGPLALPVDWDPAGNPCPADRPGSDFQRRP